MQVIDNDRVGPTIFQMHWSRIPLPKANVELLCSDRPIARPFGLDDPRAYIALPVAPRVLFLAANSKELADSISKRDHTETVKQMNRTVVTQAREFVWGSNDSQLCFIRKRIGTVPERDVITPEQRSAAIIAATGQAPQNGLACGGSAE